MSCKLLRDEEPRQVLPLFPSFPGPAVAGMEEPGPHVELDRDEAARLRAQLLETQASLEASVREAYSKGVAEGEAIGVGKATAATKPALDKLAAAVTEIAALRAKIREESETELIGLSIAVARRVLHRELSVDPDAIQGLIRAAFDKVQTREVTRVRLHPSHGDAVRKCLASLHATGIEVVADASLALGDVRLETSRGNLEASIDVQLAEIERGFADRIGR